MAETRQKRSASFADATTILAARDPVLASLVADAGPMRLRRSTMSHFAALVQAIVYQQLAGAAASAIHGRLVAALGGDVSPEPMLGLSDETLRTVGLSGAKVRSLRDLAIKVLDSTVELSPRRLSRQSDQEVIARLSTVRGIGPWSAQMFLIFQLRRMDVWPVGDLGGSPRIRPRLEHPDPDRPRAGAARRSAQALPDGVDVVLLARRRAVRGGSGQRPHAIASMNDNRNDHPELARGGLL